MARAGSPARVSRTFCQAGWPPQLETPLLVARGLVYGMVPRVELASFKFSPYSTIPRQPAV
jgi:hypothetical protein